MIRRAAIRDKVYEEQRDVLIPIAESYANQVVQCKARCPAIRMSENELWARCFCDRMKELTLALGIAVHVELGS